MTRAQVRPEIQEQIFTNFDRERSINYWSRSLQLIGPSHIPVGSTTFDAVISRNPRPQMMFCVLVPTVSMTGIRTRTPFNFVHANLTQAVTSFEGLFTDSVY